MTAAAVDAAVLHVVTDSDRRGAQVFGVELADALDRRGWSSNVVALAAGARGGLDVCALGPARLSLATLRRLRRRMACADVVVAHGSTTLPACTLAGAGLATPFVYRNIGDPLYWASSPIRTARVRVFLSRAHAVVALWPGSAHAIASAFGVRPDRIRTIPNGVPLARCPVSLPGRRPAARRQLGADPHRPTAAYVGALSGEKDVAAAVRAAGRTGIQLLVAGDGPLRAELEAQAGRDARGLVRFLGPVPDPSRVFSAADVVVLPSRSEGMPGVLIEAGLCGLGAVASAVGAVGEVVLTGRSGELVSPGDAHGLEAALVRAVGCRDAYGVAAREHCLERFEMERVADQWHDLLVAIVNGRPQTSGRTPARVPGGRQRRG